MPVVIDKNGEALKAQLKILGAHIGTYRIDLWRDSDGSGGPSAGDDYERTLKEYKVHDSASVLLGPAPGLVEKTLQFVWVVRKDPGSNQPSTVRIDLWQGVQRVTGFPVELDVPFPAGQRHGVFQASFFLKEGR